MTANWLSASIILLGAISIGYGNVANPNPRDSSVNPDRTRADKIQILDLAFRVASRIPVKPHISDRSRSQYDVLKAYVDLGLVEEAAKRANEIANWRRGIIYTDIAERYVRNKNEKKMREYLEQAQEFADTIEGFNAGWQKERVFGRVATVLAIAGLFDEAKEITSKLPGKTTLGVRVEELARISDMKDYEKSMEELGAMAESKHWEVQECVAKVYIRILKSLGKEATPERCNTIKDRFYAVVQKLPALMQDSLYCSLSRTYFEIGRQNIAEEVLSKVEDRLKDRELDATFDVVNLVELAKVYDEVAGQRERAELALGRAKELLSKSEFLPSMKQVSPNLALAGGYAVHGKKQEAWEYFQKALKFANGQKNGRPRALAIANACTAIARSSLPLQPEVKNNVKSELDRRVTVW